MTGIIIDKYKTNLYIFTDGMVTQGGYHLRHNYRQKVRRFEDKRHIVLAVLCGQLGTFDIVWMTYLHLRKDLDDFRAHIANEAKDFMKAGKTLDDTDAVIVFVQKDKRTQVVSVMEVEYPAGTIRYELDDLPIFLGSGTVALASAYKVLERQRTVGFNTKAYLKDITECFGVAESIVASVSGLTVTEVLSLD